MAHHDNVNGTAQAALMRLRGLFEDYCAGDLTEEQLKEQALGVVKTLPAMRGVPALTAARLGHICGRIEEATGYAVEVA